MSRAAPRLSDALRRDYEVLFQTCAVAPIRHGEVDRIVARFVRHRLRYAAACANTTVPWCFAAIVHELESGGNFSRHLHNGDPLRGRTVRAPKGRPPRGEPPFAWEASAADALMLQGLNRVKQWTLGQILYRLERYNGLGYRMHHPEVLSPYLWAGSNHYTRGKYVRDGRWSATAVSSQIGGAVQLRRMAEIGIAPFAVPDPAVVVFHPRRPRDAVSRERALTLQRWLNTHEGVFLREDGWPGPRTAVAYRQVTGGTLRGDPAIVARRPQPFVHERREARKG